MGKCLGVLVCNQLIFVVKWVEHNEVRLTLMTGVHCSRYIIFDTSRLINRFEPDEYVDGAIQLYLDILNMFLYILRILSKLQGKK